MKGVCLHQNMGAVGTALAEDIWHKRLIQLKKWGVTPYVHRIIPMLPSFMPCATHLVLW